MNIDSLLKQIIENGGRYASHKDIQEDERKVADKLIAYNLIEKRGNSYRITKDGYRVSEIGFEKWNELQNNPIQSVVENYTNSNVIKGSSIQGSQLQFESENAKQSKIAQTNQTNPNDTNNILKILNKYWWAFLIPIILIIIGLYIEYKYFNG